jgi:hypothetical protein
MCLFMVIMLQSLIYTWQDLFGDEHYFVRASFIGPDGNWYITSIEIEEFIKENGVIKFKDYLLTLC